MAKHRIKKHRVKLYAKRVRIDRGGYDRHGRYWGVGAPLYRVENDDGIGMEVRASSAAIAKERARTDVEREIQRDMENGGFNLGKSLGDAWSKREAE